MFLSWCALVSKAYYEMRKKRVFIVLLGKTVPISLEINSTRYVYTDSSVYTTDFFETRSYICDNKVM